METFAIGRLINDYFSKGFGQGKEDIVLLKNLIKQYQSEFSEPSLAIRMNEILRDLQNFNFKLNNAVLTQKFLTPTLDTISLGQILDKAGDKKKVIDFWGTYCFPCVREFHASDGIRKRMSQNNEVEFLYFSLDEDQEAWLNALENLKDLIPKQQNYLLINRENSSLLEFMVITENSNQTYFSIPRYSILGPKNRIISNNAPRPSDSVKFRKLVQ